jgi:hypothetical protein
MNIFLNKKLGVLTEILQLAGPPILIESSPMSIVSFFGQLSDRERKVVEEVGLRRTKQNVQSSNIYLEIMLPAGIWYFHLAQLAD